MKKLIMTVEQFATIENKFAKYNMYEEGTKVMAWTKDHKVTLITLKDAYKNVTQNTEVIEKHMEEAIEIAIAENISFGELPALTRELDYAYRTSDAQETTACKHINQDIDNEVNGFTMGCLDELTIEDVFNIVKLEINKEANAEVHRVGYLPQHTRQNTEIKNGYSTFISKKEVTKINKIMSGAVQELIIANTKMVDGKKILNVLAKTTIPKDLPKVNKIKRIERLAGLPAREVGQAVKNKTKIKFQGEDCYVAYRDRVAPTAKEKTIFKGQQRNIAIKHIEDVASKFLSTEETQVILDKRYAEIAEKRLALRATNRAEVFFNGRYHMCKTEAVFDNQCLVKVINEPLEVIEVLYNQKKITIGEFIQDFKQVKDPATNEFCTKPDGEMQFTIAINNPLGSWEKEQRVEQGTASNKYVFTPNAMMEFEQEYDYLVLEDLDRNEGGVDSITGDSRPYNYDDNPSLINDIFEEIIYSEVKDAEPVTNPRHKEESNSESEEIAEVAVVKEIITQNEINIAVLEEIEAITEDEIKVYSIEHRKTYTYTPQRNGLIIKIATGKVRDMVDESGKVAQASKITKDEAKKYIKAIELAINNIK